MTDHCSSSNSNFAIFEWDGVNWNAIVGGNCCDAGFQPPSTANLPAGTFVGQQRAEPCVRSVQKQYTKQDPPS